MSEAHAAFRAFARGYLHEDLESEHGSAADSLRSFLADASPAERRALARDAERLRALTRGWPVARLRAWLRDEAGAGWSPRRAAEFQSLLERAAQGASGPERRSNTSRRP